MSDEQITRLEMEAMIEVQRTSATHLATIASTLSQILTGQERLTEKITNGLAADIRESRQHAIDLTAEVKKAMIDARAQADLVAKDAKRAANKAELAFYAITSVCLVIALAELVIYITKKI